MIEMDQRMRSPREFEQVFPDVSKAELDEHGLTRGKYDGGGGHAERD